MSCYEVAAFLQTTGAHLYFEWLFSQCHNSKVFAAWQTAINQSPIAKKF